MSKKFNRAIEIGGEERIVGTPSVDILEYNKTGKVRRAEGATVPTDGDAGYAKGCSFVHTDGGVATTTYINEGSDTSCDFNAVESAASTVTGVTAGAGMTGGGTEGSVTLNVINTDGKITVGADTLDITTNTLVNSDLKVPVLRVYQETFAFGDMTDGEGTSGTFDLTLTIPEGAIVTQSFIDDVTGFAGDTSAVITIGDGTDVDRYNTGTPNVFATADHISAGAVSGTAYHADAKTVTVTITSNADFTNVSAGELTITIFYYQSV